jgi:hydroxyacylglutathione hydrolase
VNVLPGVDIVGSGSLGLSITHRDDSHVYLVASDDDAVLIDAGCGGDTDGILAHIRATGIDPVTVSRILLTHAHPDHAAGAHDIAHVLHAEVMADPAVADILRRADANAAGLTAARAAGLYPPPVELHPTPVTDLVDRTTLDVGHLRIQAVATPGHAAGHLCFFVEVEGCTALFSGDLVFARGRVAVLGTPDTDVALLAASVRRVRDLAPDALLPGHGTVVLQHATEHLDIAVECFDRGALPPPLLP